MSRARLCFLFLLCAYAFAVAAERDVRVITIGVTFYTTPLRETAGPVPESPHARALLEGLRERGWIDGRNARLVWRSAAEHPQGVAGTIDDLLRIPVDILVVSGNDFAVESTRRMPNLPVVLASSDFPVENGLVASLSRPGANITGLSNWVGRGMNVKRLALLKEAAPRITRVAVLFNSIPPGAQPFSAEMLHASRSMGISVLHAPVDRLEELEPAVAKAIAIGADAMFVADYPFAFKRANQHKLAELCDRHKLPAIHSASNAVDQGAMMSYGPDVVENYRRSAYFVDRILRGAKPGDIPLEEPARLEIAVNLKAARRIGLELPRSILTQATRVIE
jgi:putative ABC transport system substrate-binding protein